MASRSSSFLTLSLLFAPASASSHFWDLITTLGGLFRHSCGADGFNFGFVGLGCHSCVAIRLKCFGLTIIIADYRCITDTTSGKEPFPKYTFLKL
jgi:hypothetical protein